MTLFPVPAVLGGGKKLFTDGSAPHAYKLTRSRVSSTGVLIGHYEPDGEIRTGGAALNSPSTAETARQERMKRALDRVGPSPTDAPPRAVCPRAVQSPA